MSTLVTITFHNFLPKDRTYGKVYLSGILCDSEVPQIGKITEGLWRFDPQTESRYSISPSKANLASKEANAVFEEFTEYFNKEGVVHGNGVARKLIFKIIIIHIKQFTSDRP